MTPPAEPEMKMWLAVRADMPPGKLATQAPPPERHETAAAVFAGQVMKTVVAANQARLQLLRDDEP